MLLFDVLGYYHFYTGLKKLSCAGGLYNTWFQYFTMLLMFDREIPGTAAASPWTASWDWLVLCAEALPFSESVLCVSCWASLSSFWFGSELVHFSELDSSLRAVSKETTCSTMDLGGQVVPSLPWLLSFCVLVASSCNCASVEFLLWSFSCSPTFFTSSSTKREQNRWIR